MAEFLISKSYQTFGLIRGKDNPKRAIVEKEVPRVELIEGDLADNSSLVDALRFAEPDEVYNLGAISSVALSFEQPELSGNITGLGALRMLEAIRLVDKDRRMRFYQASSSEMFGQIRETPQHERTPFHPRSPYATAKVYAHFMTINYRESYDMFACSGILFNHEGPRRGHEYVSRKISSAVARIKLGLQDDVALGNLEAHRDWGFSGDYVRAMWLMLQQDTPDDYVVATGESHSIRDFLDLAFAEAGIEDWKNYVKQDSRFMRPAEVDVVVGDYSKANRELGWEPTVNFPQLVRMMVQHDLELEARGMST